MVATKTKVLIPWFTDITEVYRQNCSSYPHIFRIIHLNEINLNTGKGNRKRDVKDGYQKPEVGVSVELFLVLY